MYYEYLTGEEILSFDQSQIIEQAKYTYCTLRKALGKEKKKLVDTLKSFRYLKGELYQIKYISKTNSRMI